MTQPQNPKPTPAGSSDAGPRHPKHGAADASRAAAPPSATGSASAGTFDGRRGAATDATSGAAGLTPGSSKGAVDARVAAEEEYWRQQHERQPHAQGRPYDAFACAYGIGCDSAWRRGAARAETFEAMEDEMRRRYESQKPELPWSEARPAAFAAWRRVQQPPSAVDGTPQGGPF